MQKADETLVEVPFSAKIEGEEFPKIISGVIDLAFSEPDGWVIADYKTGKISVNFDDLIADYKPQIELYRKFWERISGHDVKEAGLYFIDAGKWVTV
jgi:ATP-dependent helicase/nuclease subunit A